MTTHNPARPCSSPARPAARDDQQIGARPSSPTLSGDEHRMESPQTSIETTTQLVPGRAEPRPLITDHNRPFFQHLRDLLIDGNWHHRDEVFTIGRTHGLAERTIANLLPRASHRRWISRSRGHVRIRDRAALERALDGTR